MMPVEWNPPPERLRQFGWIASGVLFLLGLAARTGRLPVTGAFPSAAPDVSTGLFAVAAASAGFSWFFPRGNRVLYVVLSAIGLPVGWLASTLALAFAFYLVVTPVGLVRRLVAVDPLKRRREPSKKTYFTEARPPRPPEDYFKLF